MLDLSQASPHIDLSVSESVENISFTFTVMDEVGNVITFDTMFCTTCLIEPQVIVEPSKTDDDGDSKKGKDSDSNEMILISVCALLALMVLLLVRKSSSKKAPKGLPSIEEDEWFGKYMS